MAEPDDARFACIGCGVLNPAGAEVCSGCGHRFAGPGPSPTRAILSSPAPAPSTNPYQPPASRPVGPGTFTIRSILLVIVLIAVVLWVFTMNPAVGTLLAVSVVPAAIRTVFVARRKGAEGRPFGFDEGFRVFALSLGGSFLVLVSSAIAFVASCFPIGMIGASSGLFYDITAFAVACAIGGVVALAVGAFVTWQLLKNSRAREAMRRESEDR